MSKKGNGGSGGYGSHNRPHSPKSERVAAALPTPDPDMPESMMCLTDKRYNVGGLLSGGIKTTVDPKSTP